MLTFIVIVIVIIIISFMSPIDQIHSPRLPRPIPQPPIQNPHLLLQTLHARNQLRLERPLPPARRTPGTRESTLLHGPEARIAGVRFVASDLLLAAAVAAAGGGGFGLAHAFALFKRKLRNWLK